MKRIGASLAALLALGAIARGAERTATEPAHWRLAPTPPMGWNSYDAFGSSVTEDEVLANATYLKQHLLAHGWNHVVVDFRWSDATAANYGPNGVGGPGRWPDFDMLPLGRIGIRSVGGDRVTRFTRDEQVMLMTLWALGPSPLMLGMNLPDNDAWTRSLLTNDEVLAIHQDPLGRPARRISRRDGAEVWLRDLDDGAKAAGLFNRGERAASVTLSWSEAGLSGRLAARDLWRREQRGSFDAELSMPVPPHGAVLLRLSPGSGPAR
jgi:hypothetical protein